MSVQYDIGVLTFDNQIEIEGAGNKSFSSDAGIAARSLSMTRCWRRALLFAGGDHGGTNGQGPDVRQSDRCGARGPQSKAPP